jgi:hypothetical protein
MGVGILQAFNMTFQGCAHSYCVLRVFEMFAGALRRPRRSSKISTSAIGCVQNGGGSR